MYGVTFFSPKSISVGIFRFEFTSNEVHTSVRTMLSLDRPLTKVLKYLVRAGSEGKKTGMD